MHRTRGALLSAAGCGQWPGYCDKWKAAGFSPVYVMPIDPNVVFFAWRGNHVPPARPAAAPPPPRGR
jgi:hypothetical protein